MILFNGKEFKSTKELPFPFKKRRDGNFYAKANMDTLKICLMCGYPLDKSVEEFKTTLFNDLKRFKGDIHTTTPEILYNHQGVAYRIVMNNKRGALFMEQGTGKTLPVLLAMEHLYNKGEVKRILVLCPKRVIQEWIRQHDEFGLTIPINNLRKSGKVIDGINVINYALVWRREYTEFDTVILDESHKIKNSGTKINGFLVNHVKSERRYLLTGTSGDRPEDYFGQYKYMDSRIFGESKFAFKETFTWYDQKTGQVWGLKKNMKDKFWGRVHAVSYWVRKEECLDLPEQVDIFEYVELPSKVMKHLKEITEDNITTLKSGKVIVADNELVSSIKRRQMIQGHVEGERLHSEKIKAVKDMDFTEPTIFFTTYTQDAKDLLEVYPNASVLTGWRDDLDRFLDGDTDILICNYASANAGINLQRASTMVFYGLTWSYTMYDQARARIHRIGQNDKCTYIHLIAVNTLDERVMKALKNKEDFVITGVEHERKLFAEESNQLVK